MSRSENSEPPNPRLTTSSGFMSEASVSQNRKLELPAKTMLPGLGGCALSCSSKSRIAGSHPCAETAGKKERRATPRSSAPKIPTPNKCLFAAGPSGNRMMPRLYLNLSIADQDIRSRAVANILAIQQCRDYASAQMGWGASGNLETGQSNENATAKRRTKQWNT